MADTKISQLPAATTPLSGAEVVPLVQSGATVQTPVNELSLLTAATANTFTANQVISVTDNTNAALRVTQLGTGLALRIEDATNPDSTPVVVDASGNLGVGVTAPGVKADIVGVMRSATWSLSGTGIAGGTSAFAAGTVSTDVNWGMYFRVPTGSASNAEFSWRNAADAERFRVDTNGNVLVTGSGGLGYGTGSGGTVTQITSKSTGVTINKTNGTIVTTGSALAGNTTVQFSVTNSTVAATDTVLVQLASGDANTGNNYQVWVGFVTAGSFVVTLLNRSGGSRSETLTLNFSIIKAVTS